MRLHPIALGLLFMALAAAFFGYTFTFPALPGQKYGPSLFPRVIAAGIFGCGLVIAWQGRHAAQAWIALDEALRSRRAAWSFALVPLAVVAYLLLAPSAGFLPTAALLVAVLAWWFGTRVSIAMVVGVVTSFVVHWFFASVMRVPLPRGWFMQVLFGG